MGAHHWGLVFHREPAGKLRSVVGQEFGDIDGRGNLPPPEDVDAAEVSHSAMDLQEHPARGAVDGHAQVVKATSLYTTR